ncbi:MAG: hypothetical protein ACK57O_12920, partial [Planctomyces sp.]
DLGGGGEDRAPHFFLDATDLREGLRIGNQERTFRGAKRDNLNSRRSLACASRHYGLRNVGGVQAGD